MFNEVIFCMNGRLLNEKVVVRGCFYMNLTPSYVSLPFRGNSNDIVAGSHYGLGGRFLADSINNQVPVGCRNPNQSYI